MKRLLSLQRALVATKQTRLKIIIFFLFFFIASTVYALGADSYPFTTNQEATRFAALTKEVRCVVCQNQNIADSTAPLANDLRTKIYYMIIEKKTDEEIKSYLVKRYGEFILLKPRISIITLLLWIFPFIGLMLILIALKRMTSWN